MTRLPSYHARKRKRYTVVATQTVVQPKQLNAALAHEKGASLICGLMSRSHAWLSSPDTSTTYSKHFTKVLGWLSKHETHSDSVSLAKNDSSGGTHMHLHHVSFRESVLQRDRREEQSMSVKNEELANINIASIVRTIVTSRCKYENAQKTLQNVVHENS